MQLHPEEIPRFYPDATDVAVLHTLIYFDIFHHPLTTDEVHHNCQWEKCTLSETALALEKMREAGIVKETDGFWLFTGREHLAALRRERNERALLCGKKARRYSKLIASFPFVRGVFISGSLSKGTMDPDGDIDYFILTEPGRLWVARTALVAFKKIFLFNSKKYFCVNYFLDTENLSVPDRNLFVATEISFLKPMHGADVFGEFMDANQWTSLFYPNRKKTATAGIAHLQPGMFKRFFEFVFRGKAGDRFDQLTRRVTVWFWKKKFRHVPAEDFEVRFRSTKKTSKHHPNGFQERVKAAMEERRKSLGSEWNFSLPAQTWEWKTSLAEEK
ncbi:MAG TPA: nucleotidyltransferase domain-containing protein [Bacteroidia bacterium]|nr:nucleotidyltransferase domain-containing protein [Bacteroidia bacterium]